ncbi:hypothetical protein ACFQYP_21285 [Nonomuraea antimicrobica]
MVAPLVSGVAHGAALIGPGSEVLEFDTARSADHDWGPRVLLFVAAGRVAEVEAKVVAGLPDRFGGLPTVFGYHGRVRPGVAVAELGEWLVERLGFDPRAGVSLLDWLAAPWQSLAEVTGGEVFHDGLGRRGWRRPGRRCAGIRRTCGVTCWPASGGGSRRRSRSPAGAARWATNWARPWWGRGWRGR